MIKQLLIISALTCGAINTSIGQEGICKAVPVPADKESGTQFKWEVAKPVQSSVPASTTKSICTDKVTYVDRHPLFAFTQIGGDQWVMMMQEFPEFTGQITQVEFDAATYVPSSKTVAVRLFDPTTGSLLGSTSVAFNDTSGMSVNAVFSSPVSITNGVRIGILPPVNDSIKLYVNSTGNARGLTYAISSNQMTYNWLQDYGYDYDVVIRPTIKFSVVNPVLTASTLTSCTGQAVNFTQAPESSIPSFYTSPVYSPGGVFAKTLVYGDGTTNSSTFPASHSYTTPGTKEASLTYTYDGWTTDCVSDPSIQTIVVNSPTQADFAWTSVHLAVTFYNTSSNATSYSWNFGDGGTASAPNPVHNYTAPGTYTVELTATGPCGTVQHFTNITITATTNEGNLGVDENESALLNVYPNPSTDHVNVAITLEKTEDVSIIVLDALGRTVYTQNLGAVQSLVQPVDLSAYRAGVYMMRIIHDGAISTRSFVKQ